MLPSGWALGMNVGCSSGTGSRVATQKGDASEKQGVGELHPANECGMQAEENQSPNGSMQFLCQSSLHCNDLNRGQASHADLGEL
ncbi:hypothetical protein RBWH47_05587 [Rhodopirellula baltica WH47]|uniref:Uncharacterized protein n=1 Tax=Rhodopirellula baltica WH47 TaxID=991778 RepID=F2ATF8_RHOBT|nr:hypothetical protein RBWH47_05587 [Rhodopirellula baltica WH47]